MIVLADEAERPDDINVSEVEELQQQIKQRLSDHPKQDDEFYQLQADLKRSTTRLQVGSN